jgi:hypothetical protein
LSGGDEFGGFEVIAGGLLEDADEDTERRMGAFPNPPVEESPVVPLGFIAGKVVFAMPEGEIRTELAAKIGQMLRTDIFACQAGQSFLTYWRDSDDKFQRDLATIWFVRKCRDAGYWDLARAVRSLGVWPGDAGAVVLHKGDEVWSIQPGPEVSKLSIAAALKVRKGPLYRLRPSAASPASPCSVADGAWVRAQLDRWRFEPIGLEGLTGADALAGWIVAAMLGAVPPFRGHVLLSALPGAGKTTLIILVHALISAVAGDIITSFTDAGLRNDLAGEARPVLIDEAEASPDGVGPGPVERALELLRRMSTGSGGTRKQGDVGGGVATQTAVGAVLMAAVNAPRLGPADGTRIVEVRLLPLAAPAPPGSEGVKLSTDEELADVIARAAALAPALLGRALAGAWRYREDVGRLKAALMQAEETPRSADLVAMLAAGRRLLLFDAPLTDLEAAEEVAFWRPLLVQREALEVVSNPGADALAHLMNADSGQHVRDRRQTLGELLQRQLGTEREYDDVLKAHGLKVFEHAWEDGSPGPWLLVANHHPALERIFGRTHWRDWRRALAYLDALGPTYATKPTKPQWFGVGVKQRGLAIPLTPWLDKGFRRPVPPRNGAVPDGVPEQVFDP